jgi:hypothetical protein
MKDKFAEASTFIGEQAKVPIYPADPGASGTADSLNSPTRCIACGQSATACGQVDASSISWL